MRRFSFWFTFLASCLTAAWLTQTTLSHELCTLLQSADSRIQAISPLNGRLYILVNEQAYSLPLTAQTVVNNPGSLTLRSIEHLGHWTSLPFLGGFASLNNSETPLYQARLWFDYGKVSASLVFGKAASSEANTSTLLPEKQCFLDGPTVTCETYTPFGLLTKSSQSKVIRLDSPANFSVPSKHSLTSFDQLTHPFSLEPSSILRTPPLGEQLIAVLNAQTPLYYKPGKERDISLPPNDYNLTSPEIGFIHGGKMHLWLPQTGTVLLLNVPPDIASITDWGVSTKLRTVPLAEYLHCTGLQMKETQHN